MTLDYTPHYVEKWEISVPELKFVSYIVSAVDIWPNNDKVEAIINMKPPKNVTEVRCFLGMVNQLAKFSLVLADLSAPIHELLHKDRDWSWLSAQNKAFCKIKEVICSVPTLALYDPNKETLACADSSSYGIGAAICQRKPDNTWWPVANGSRLLTDTKSNMRKLKRRL